MLVVQWQKRNLPKSVLLIKPVAFIIILFHHYCCGYLSLLVALQRLREDFIENLMIWWKMGDKIDVHRVPIKGKQNNIGLK